MRIYLAARYSRRQELMSYALDLAVGGHEVTSRWLDGSHDNRTDRDCALIDLADLHRAECLIAFTEGPGIQGGRARGGRHVEFGVALGRRPHMRLIVVGFRENVFHYLDQVEFYETWELARAALCDRQFDAQVAL